MWTRTNKWLIHEKKNPSRFCLAFTDTLALAIESGAATLQLPEDAIRVVKFVAPTGISHLVTCVPDSSCDASCTYAAEMKRREQ